MRSFTLSLSAVLALTIAASTSVLGRQTPAPAGAPAKGAGRGGGGGGPIVSPQIAADGRVTFRLRAPNAKEVVVTGAGQPQQQPLAMQKDEQGVWSATTAVLAPDIYTYSFRVDGTTITDPSNRDYQTSFG